MLYHFLYPLHNIYSIFNVFKYITFRTFAAALTALLFCLIVGPVIIKLLAKKKISQPIRNDGPQSHLVKSGTPTMGGSLIIISLLVSTLLWADLTNIYIWLVIGLIVLYGAIGFIDDYKKFRSKSVKGLSGKIRFTYELVVATLIAIFLYKFLKIDTSLYIPFFKNIQVNLGWWYIPLMIFIISGTANAVNLTDGLDGLAIGPVMTSAATLALLCYIAGHFKIAEYLQIPFVKGGGELTIFAGSMVAAGLGFLWYNTYPASVFMGDVGSLSLGGALGIIAVISKNEILFVIIGGVFVLEAISVIGQVISFQLTRKRIFKMAPLHHHFELKGWAEPKVIVRFWIISIIMALIALSTLKIR